MVGTDYCCHGNRKQEERAKVASSYRDSSGTGGTRRASISLKDRERQDGVSERERERERESVREREGEGENKVRGGEREEKSIISISTEWIDGEAERGGKEQGERESQKHRRNRYLHKKSIECIP